MFRVYQTTFHVFLTVLVMSFFYVLIKMLLRVPFPWKSKKKDPTFPKFGLVLLLASIAGVGGLTYFMSAQARARVSERMSKLSHPFRVTINGQQATDPDAIVAALKFDDIDAHHSHPTKRIEVRIQDQKESFVLVLARDSERAAEYWVYSPQDDYTKGLSEGHEIGRIATHAFDGY